jgi:hypothetical protein
MRDVLADLMNYAIKTREDKRMTPGI